MIQIAICDDEKKILDEMSGYIQSYAEKKSITDLEVFPFESTKTLIGAIEDGKSFDVFIFSKLGKLLCRNAGFKSHLCPTHLQINEFFPKLIIIYGHNIPSIFSI